MARIISGANAQPVISNLFRNAADNPAMTPRLTIEQLDDDVPTPVLRVGDRHEVRVDNDGDLYVWEGAA